MNDKNWIEALFESIDGKDTTAFLAFLAEDVFFRFGNAEPVRGKTNVGNVIKGFFASINGLQHDIVQSWSQDDTVICHGFVTYTRLDASTLTVPFANIFNLHNQAINEYLIFVDTSDLYGRD